MVTNNLKLTDEILSKVACRVNELMLEQFDSNSEAPLESYTPSEEFQKAASEIINGYSRRRMTSRTVRRIFIIAAILVMLFIFAIGVSAMRNAVCKFVFALDTEHAAMSCNVEADEFDAPAQIINYREPSYIPKGLEMVNASKSSSALNLQYGSDSNYLLFSQNPLSTCLDINTKDAVYGEIDVNGHAGFYSVLKSECILVWNDSEYVYTICSDLDMDTVLAIAESVG